mmetsp:Transcript_97469/g.303589  ORF Transcript_97469/g.303589 Transcript_97469/m.303589 type:complete len:903 (-) Transcript_97469:103-2811(-)
MLCGLQDAALAAPEAAPAGLLASRPVAPLRQQAVLRRDGVALHGLVQRPLARSAVERGHLHDVALPVLLTLLTVHLARGPGGPIGQDAVPPVRVSRHAALGLAHGTLAGLPALVALRHDVSLPLAEPRGRGLAPLAPGVKLAVKGNARRRARRGGRAGAEVELRPLAPGPVIRPEERVFRRGREAQRPALHRRTLAAAHAASSGGRPRRPGAEEACLAVAAALLDLLGALKVAHAPAVVWHLADGAVAVPLANAARALAPLGPVGPGAVLAALLHAGVRVARGRDGELGIARLAAVGRQVEDLSFAIPLASVAGLGAHGPVGPEAEAAVRRAGELASARRGLGRAWVAGARLLQRYHVAVLPVAAWEDLDEAVTLMHAEARPGAEGPFAPVGELAVSVRGAGRLLAGLVLVPQTRRRPATRIRLALHGPAPHRIGAAASRGASTPILPLAPEAVDALLPAGMSVARGGLALRQGIARRAPVLRESLDHAVPVHQATPATRRAGGPVIPLAPLAVGVRAHAALAEAGPGLLHRTLAALAVQRLRVGNLPRARSGSLAALRGADGPLGPLCEVAGDHAREDVASLELPHRAARAAAAVPGWRLHHACAECLAAATLLAALGRVRLPPAEGAPFAPLGELARLLNWSRAALRLLQRLVAALADAHSVLHDLPLPEALGVRLRVAHRPVRPLPDDAVLALASRGGAGLCLEGHVLAGLAAVAGLPHHPAHAGVPASATRGAARCPVLPVREEAGLGVLLAAAGHGLLRAASAGLTAIRGRAQHSALAVDLARGVSAGAPGRPDGERAVPRDQQAVLWDVLHRLYLGAIAGLAALVARNGDAPLAELESGAVAKGVVPLSPVAKLAVDRRAVLAAGQARAETPHFVKAMARVVAGGRFGCQRGETDE